LGAALLFTGVAARPAAADDQLSVVLANGLPALMDALDLVAEGAGFYKQQHLAVSKIFVKGRAYEASLVCSSGQGDICPIGIEPLLTGYPNGIRLKLFLSRAAHFAYVIAVLDGSPIMTPADFKGKSIGVHDVGPGSSGSFTTESNLAGAGLKSTDYTLVPIGYESQAFDAVVSGKVDAAAFPSYELIPFVVAGKKLRIFYHPTLKDVANVGYAASPAVIATKSDELARFSRAIVEAALLVRYNPVASARLMLQARGAPFTDADVQTTTAELQAWEPDLPAADPANRRIGALSLTGLQPYIQLLTDVGVTKTAIPSSEVVTDQFVDFANAFDHASIEKLAKQLH
jgi:ABC-type nitrate/sulfonate/bicarbonate transport system substrate-binding protein